MSAILKPPYEIAAEDEFEPMPERPGDTVDAAPENLDFVVFYAGSDFASSNRAQTKLRALHPTCPKFLRVCNPEISLDETVEQLSAMIISSLEELNPAKLAKQLHVGDRLHGGHGNRGPMGVVVDFIRNQLRLREQGPAWRLYVDVKFPEVFTLLRERGYDPIPMNAAWARGRKRIYPWWLMLKPRNK